MRHDVDPGLPEMTYPALYVCADAASSNQQSFYHQLIKWEYAALTVAAVLTLPLSELPTYFAFHAAALFVGLAVLIWRSSAKPEQRWYRNRALAELVKTSTWRYVMRAAPFDAPELPAAKAAFRAYLTSVIKTNADSGELGDGVADAGKHTTDEMELIRALEWQKRRDYYVRYRIIDQLSWYKSKTALNRSLAQRWHLIAVCVYLVAAGLILVRIAEPRLLPIWPIEPLLVATSCVTGWTQIRKFNELASIYALTALEVQLIHDQIVEIDNEAELSSFINQAELAFSREHTQWVARQSQ